MSRPPCPFEVSRWCTHGMCGPNAGRDIGLSKKPMWFPTELTAVIYCFLWGSWKMYAGMQYKGEANSRTVVVSCYFGHLFTQFGIILMRMIQPCLVCEFQLDSHYANLVQRLVNARYAVIVAMNYHLESDVSGLFWFVVSYARTLATLGVGDRKSESSWPNGCKNGLWRLWVCCYSSF